MFDFPEGIFKNPTVTVVGSEQATVSCVLYSFNTIWTEAGSMNYFTFITLF